MGESRNYARTTISVHPDIKDQMDAVQEEVNWSAVASRAFEDKLAEIAAHKEKKDMKDIVTRLRASKRHVDDEQYKAGVEAGRKWAGATAEADDLQRLDAWRRRISAYPGPGWDAFFAEDAGNGQSFSAAEQMFFDMYPGHEGNSDGAKQFWTFVLGYEWFAVNNLQFLKGCTEGALALWNEVKDQL